MANRVASIMVLGLTCPSQYVDTFTVELYSDATLVNRVAADTSAAVWDGLVSSQFSEVVFSGLVYGETYWVRAGTSSSYSPTISWTAPFSLQAGYEDQSFQQITYSGNYVATTSGVSYTISPHSVPLGVARYEMYFVVNNTTVPGLNVTPHWSGEPNATGSWNAGFVAVPGNVVYAYVRAVSTSGYHQFWEALTPVTVSNATTYGSIDEIPDGQTYAKTRASGLTNGSVDPTKTTGVLKLGSLSPSWSGSLYWAAAAQSSSSGTVYLWWDQLVFKRIDGTQTVVGSLPKANAFLIQNLAVTTDNVPITYDFYPFLDENTKLIDFLRNGDSGSPTWAYNDSNITLDSATTTISQMNRQDRIGIGPIQIVMPVYVPSQPTSAQPIYMSDITAHIFRPYQRGVVGVIDGTTPLWTQTFNSLMFNTHPSKILPGDPHDSGNLARPVVNNIVSANGNYAGDIVVTGNGQTLWQGALNGFQMSCTGTFTVSGTGIIAFTPFFQNGWVLGVGGGATLNSTWSSNNIGGQGTTPVLVLGTLVGRNARDHRYDVDANNPFAIFFPHAGTYPFELVWAGGDDDIVEGCLLANSLPIPPYNAGSGGGGSGTGVGSSGSGNSGTATGGTGGGGYGGGGYQCPRYDMLVEERTKGIITADQIEAGDELKTTQLFGDWVKVLSAKPSTQCWWVEVVTAKSGSVIVHPNTHIPLSEQDSKEACDLCLNDIVFTAEGEDRVISLRAFQEDSYRIMLTCFWPKVFLCGKDSPTIVIHNTNSPNPC